MHSTHNRPPLTLSWSQPGGKALKSLYLAVAVETKLLPPKERAVESFLSKAMGL